MKSVSEKELVDINNKLMDINNKLNRLAETTHEIQCKLNRTSTRIEEIAKTIENNKDTTNTVYKLVEKQDYNSKHSRLWLPIIALCCLYMVIGQEQLQEQLIMYSLLVALYVGYVYYSRD